MAQPLDIRVVFHPETGFRIIVEEREVNTADLGSSAVLWNVVRYLVERLPDQGHTDELHMAALQMTEFFQRQTLSGQHSRQEEGYLQQQMTDCPPPDDSMDECCICMDRQPGEQWVKLLPCDHKFHVGCITAWTNPTCPLCRGDLTRNVRRRI